MKVNALELIVEEVRKQLEADNHLSALMIALTIPDICGKILYPKDKCGERYRKWFDMYIGDYEQSPFAKEDEKWRDMPYMDGRSCYKLRCSLLHSGSDDIAEEINLNEFRLLFGKSAILGSSAIEQRIDYMTDGSIIEGNKIRKLDVNVNDFCNKIIWAAEAFLRNEIKDKTDIPTIQIIPEIPDIFKTNRKTD